MPRLLLLAGALAAVAAAPFPSTDPAGLWLGVLKVGPIDLRVAFKVDRGKDGKLSGKLISIDQDSAEVPFDKATFTDGKLTLDAGKGALVFTGRFDRGGLTGQLKQGPVSFPLKLERIEKMPTFNRPQTPKKPYPYPSEDVVFENASAKIKLAGTLTLPKGDGPFPAVILVSGSGPQDRDETIFQHRPFLVIADHLARHGIAALRYDDRGFGKSGGKFVGATTKDFATDAEAALDFLKKHRKVDPRRIGVCGHSEGGAIAPLVAAARPDDVAFIILLAGPGISGERVMYEQMVDFSRLLDEKADEKDAKKFFEAVLPIIKSEAGTAEVRKKLQAALQKLAAEEKEEKNRKAFEEAIPAAVERMSDPWFRWFVSYDPAATLKKVRCPVLALNGEKDIQVKAKQNLSAIAAALKAGGNRKVTTAELKGLNHLFQTCKTGLFTEYGHIEETFAPSALKRISDWVAALK